jgi:hypothetical protein
MGRFLDIHFCDGGSPAASRPYRPRREISAIPERSHGEVDSG